MQQGMNSSKETRYMFVIKYIKDQIRRGHYRVNELLPGQRILAEQLDVSRPSVRRAIDLLEADGILKCTPSSGSVVMRLPDEKMLVGYFVQDLQDPFHIDLIHEMDRLLRKVNGGIIASQGKDESRLLNMGITCAIKQHVLFDPSLRPRVQTIYTGRVPEGNNMIVADIDNGMKMICRHLRELGHRRIGYASQFPSESDIVFPHLIKAIKADGDYMENVKTFIVDPHDTQRCLELAQSLKDNTPSCTALVCYNDWLAIALLRAAKQVGLAVPDRLSMTGFDDLFVSGIIEVPLTTIEYPRKEIAKRLFNMLQQNSLQPITEVVQTQLIIRQSTKKPIGN
jgi:DNA-binding LacI/PurR family transcriptional regulator